MKISCFVMMRNEQSILNPFLDQLLEFFDRIIVVDHGSTDQSRALITARKSEKIEVFELISAGYPQEQVATQFFRREVRTHHPDWMFFLDCDEFLPFHSRTDLEAALRAQKGNDLVFMHWRNLCPGDLTGVDIFQHSFSTLKSVAETKKVAVSGQLLDRFPMMRIYQGYHGVGGTINTVEGCLSSRGLFHIPVQSRARYVQKVGASARRLIEEKHLLQKGLGQHWVRIFEEITKKGAENFNYEDVALHYPDPPMGHYQTEVLDFDFPYVQSSYEDHLNPVTESKNDKISVSGNGNDFVVLDSKGVELFSSKVKKQTASCRDDDLETALEKVLSHRVPTIVGTDLSARDVYGKMVEPLFCLPTQLDPNSPWAGHVPFMFVLVKMLRPTCYLKIGTADDSSLCAVASASVAYQTPATIICMPVERSGSSSPANLDRVKAIAHQGHAPIEVREVHDWDATRSMLTGLVDILHISSIKSIDEVRAIQQHWASALKEDAIILIDDIAVKEPGFDVSKEWQKLTSLGNSIGFYHGRGLGLLLSDVVTPRTQTLHKISRSEEKLACFQLLASDIGHLVKPRVDHLSTWSFAESTQNEHSNTTSDSGFLEALKLEDGRRNRSFWLKTKNFMKFGCI